MNNQRIVAGTPLRLENRLHRLSTEGISPDTVYRLGGKRDKAAVPDDTGSDIRRSGDAGIHVVDSFKPRMNADKH